MKLVRGQGTALVGGPVGMTQGAMWTAAGGYRMRLEMVGVSDIWAMRGRQPDARGVPTHYAVDGPGPEGGVKLHIYPLPDRDGDLEFAFWPPLVVV